MSGTRICTASALDRLLFSSVACPGDYGFFPRALGEDGAALHAVVRVENPTFPGCVITVKAVSLFRIRYDDTVDDNVVRVPARGVEIGAA